MSETCFITFLGVGGGLSPELGNNNVLLESPDRKTNLLVDCGPITAHDLKYAGRLAEIQNLFITHVHDDHVGGLQLWGQLNRYVYRQAPPIYFREELWDELWEGSLRGGLAQVNDAQGQPTKVGMEAYFQPKRLKEGESVSIAGLPLLTPRATVHVPGKPCFGFFIGDDIYYSTDSRLLPPTHGPTGKPLRMIFQDCQLFDAENAVHTPYNKLVAEMAPAQKAVTWLMHYNYEPDFDPREAGFLGFVKRHQPIPL